MTSVTYMTLLHAAADSVRDCGMVDIVTLAQAVSEGFDVSDFTAAAVRLADTDDTNPST